MCMCRPIPRMTLVWYKKIAWNDVLVYQTGGIAKRLAQNKQSTPTPYRDIDIPLSGSGYTTSMSVLRLLYSLCVEIGDFLFRIKFETLLYENMSHTPYGLLCKINEFIQ